MSCLLATTSAVKMSDADVWQAKHTPTPKAKVPPALI